MGIVGLLPFVKKACRQGTISEFKGCSIAVDVSCLLHKGLFGCMEQFANGEDSKFYIHYVNKHVKCLLDLGCHVIMVFDGRPLPAKKETNDDRRQRRIDNMRAGEVLLSQGKKDEAITKFQQAVSITQEVVDNAIEFFRSMPNVDVIVSPYESDAQLAFLTNNGLADAVITEDSDLIAFGCEKIIFKFVSQSGECTIYEKDKLSSCFSGEMGSNFDFTKFRRVCILSGCDYLKDGLPGIGLSKALKFFSKTSQPDLRVTLPRIPGYLDMKKLKVTKEFIEDFIRAENTFLHQVVFDPRQRCQRPLTPYPINKNKENSFLDDDDEFIRKPNSDSNLRESYKYAGTVAAAALSVRLALGNVAEKQQSLLDKFLLPAKVPDWSIWYDRFESQGKKKNRQDEDTKIKAKQCGAFKLDSPSKKVKKPVQLSASLMEDETIFLDDSPEKSALKVPVKRKLKNEADQSWSVDEVMKFYADDATTASDISTWNGQSETVRSTLTELQVEEYSVDPVMDDTKTETVTATSVVTTKRRLSFSSPLLPVPSKTVSLDTSTNNSQITVTKVSGKSSYFTARSPGVSNPFKRVRVLDPSAACTSPSSTTSSPIANPAKKSALSSLGDDGVDDSGTISIGTVSLPRTIGFRAPGLRRSITK